MPKRTDEFVISLPLRDAATACRSAAGRFGWLVDSELPGELGIVVPLTVSHSPSRIRARFMVAGTGQTSVTLTGKMGGSHARRELGAHLSRLRRALEHPEAAPAPKTATASLFEDPTARAASPQLDDRAPDVLRRPGPGLQADGSWVPVPFEPRRTDSFSGPFVGIMLAAGVIAAVTIALIVTLGKTQHAFQHQLNSAFQQVQSALQQGVPAYGYPYTSTSPYTSTYPYTAGGNPYTSTSGSPYTSTIPAPGTATRHP